MTHRTGKAKILVLAGLCTMAGACQQGEDANLPGNLQDSQPFSGIAEDETIRLAGTEPFWGGTVEASIFTYTTPENMEGTVIPVTRFAGRGGVSFSGEVEGQEVVLAVTPGECSDGMSGRTYPYTVTLQWGAEQRNGCGWSDSRPHDGAPA